MRREYFTSNSSVYIQSVEADKELWARRAGDGGLQRLSGAVHISRRKFEELMAEYQSALPGGGVCLDAELAAELFGDAQREKFIGNIANDDTTIFFLVAKDPGAYEIGCSSTIKRIEQIQ
ncbi:MAG: hypothetical protein PHY02_05280 [Phycisphaerae bacterium]|nr:hypothetical protein [Phycisphaerae bacterium]